MDFYLHMQLSGRNKYASKAESNDVYNEFIEKESDMLAQSLINKEIAALNPLLSRIELIAKYKAEIIKSIRMPKLELELALAFSLLKNEGTKYMSQEVYITMVSNFNTLSEALAISDTENMLESPIPEFETFTGNSVRAISEMATSKFNEAQYSDCFAMYALLVTLKPLNPDLWYRLGIAAQLSNHIELAIKAFESTVSLAGKSLLDLGAKVFTTQCYIHLLMFDEAKSTLSEAKKLALELQNLEWSSLIEECEQKIRAQVF